jgi:hypothetical protein
MFRLSQLLSPPRKPSRKSSFKPQFESLEKRDALSASSAAIHAVADAHGNSAVFYINEQNHAFYEHDPYNGTRMLSGPNTVQSFSAGLDTNGYADVFVKAGDGSFWEFSDQRGGWLKLLNPGALPFWNWWQVPGSGSVSALDAVTDTSNRDAVFVKNTNGTFGEFYKGNYTQLAGTINILWIHIPVVNSFSAGLDQNGNADVYASFWTGSLEKNVGGTWTYVAASGTYTQFSATDAGQVWFLDKNGSLEKYDAQGNLHDVYNNAFRSISAARSNDVYGVDFVDDSLWERTGGGVWHEISGPGTVKQ